MKDHSFDNLTKKEGMVSELTKTVSKLELNHHSNSVSSH
jgi:hypothetical protein